MPIENRYPNENKNWFVHSIFFALGLLVVRGICGYFAHEECKTKQVEIAAAAVKIAHQVCEKHMKPLENAMALSDDNGFLYEECVKIVNTCEAELYGCEAEKNLSLEAVDSVLRLHNSTR